MGDDDIQLRELNQIIERLRELSDTELYPEQFEEVYELLEKVPQLPEAYQRRVDAQVNQLNELSEMAQFSEGMLNGLKTVMKIPEEKIEHRRKAQTRLESLADALADYRDDRLEDGRRDA